MEPNITNNQEEQPVQPVQAPPITPPETTAPEFTQPEQSRTTIPNPKKSNKKLYIVVSVIVILVIAALIGYFVLANNKPTPADNGKNGTNAADTSRVGLITSILTNSAADESKTTNTSDSNVAGDASSAANSVGDSVNENNLK